LIQLSKALKHLVAPSLDKLVPSGMKGLNTIERLLRGSTESEKKKATINVKDVRILAPIASPPKIICLGLNYRDHAAEQNASLPEEPIIFIKPHTAIIGPEEPIVKPVFVKELDYEAEFSCDYW